MICYLLIFAMFVGIKTIREKPFSHFAYVFHDYFILALFIQFFFCVYVLKINNIYYLIIVHHMCQKIDEGETPTVSKLYLCVHQTKGSQWVDDKSKAAYVSCFVPLHLSSFFYLLCKTNL